MTTSNLKLWYAIALLLCCCNVGCKKIIDNRGSSNTLPVDITPAAPAEPVEPGGPGAPTDPADPRPPVQPS